MQYIVESIGSYIPEKDLPKLAERLNNRAASGYRFHSVFQVTQPSGCLGLGKPVINNVAVYVKD